MTDLLGEVLADARVVTRRELRANHAERARQAQARHTRHVRNFVLCTSIAAIAGAFILYGAGGEPSREGSISDTLFEWLARGPVRTALFGLQVAALGLAAFSGYALGQTAVSGEWVKERRAAERGRVDLVDAVMAVARERGPDHERAAFDHFLAAQLDRQLAFYAEAEKRHRREFDRTASLGAVVAAAAASGAAMAGLSGLGGEIWVAVAAGIGVVAPILANAVKSWQEATMDREKADRYREAWQALIHLKAESEAARRAADAGEFGQARALVEKVHAVMLDENAGWRPAKVPT